MERVIFLFTFCLLMATASTLTVYKDCLVNTTKSDVEEAWIGSSIDITVWVPTEFDNHNQNMDKQSMEVMKLELHCNKSKSDKHGCDIINIRQSNLRRTELNETGNLKSETNFTIKNPLGHGWLDFRLSLSGNLTLWHKATKQIIINIPDYARLEKVIIVGRHITTNCLQPDIGWEVENGQEIVIPLAMNVTSHNISLFSNDPVIPHITINNENFKLGWDNEGKKLLDVTKFSKEHADPLPVSIQHWFTLTCTGTSSNVTCNMQDNTHKDFKTFGNLRTLPNSIKVKVDQKTFIYFHRQTDSQTDTHSEAPHMVTAFVTGVAVNPEAVVHGAGNTFWNSDKVFMAATAVLSCIVLVMACIITILLRIFTRKRREHDNHQSHSPNEEVPLTHPDS